MMEVCTERVYAFPRTGITKCHKLGGLKQQKCIVSTVTVPLKPIGENPSLLLGASSVCRQFLAFLGLWMHHSNLFPNKVIF